MLWIETKHLKLPQKNEHDQRFLESPEYQRIPTAPAPIPPPFIVPAAAPSTHYSHLPSDLAAAVDALPPFPQCGRGRGRGHAPDLAPAFDPLPARGRGRGHAPAPAPAPAPVPLPFHELAAQYAALPHPAFIPPHAPLPFAQIAQQYAVLAPMVPQPPAPLPFAEIAQQYAALPPVFPPASSFHSPSPSPPPPALPHIPPQHMNVQATMEEAQGCDERWMQQICNVQRNQQHGERQLRSDDITNNTSRHLPSTPPPNNQPQNPLHNPQEYADVYVDVQAAMEEA
ncbi:hypothetical protein BYT27DRAFT_7317807 [Phlegmacium glaucopus]|nr:hypothetical protein BYT27DRAFT_7317807 [Phlegmacium glaucopus]